jgi:hypothetical protein
MNLKPLITGAILGIICGFLIGASFNHFQMEDRYTIHTMSNSRIEALRIDKKTGEVWQMDYRGSWTRAFPTNSI